MPAQYLLCTRTIINESSFLSVCQWFTLALRRKKKKSPLFLNNNILWPWERQVIKCFQATIKAQNNKTQKIPKLWKCSRLKGSKPGFTEEKQGYLVWLQQCRGDGNQLCRSSAASPSAVLDTDSSCALSLASEQGELLSCAEPGRDTCSIFLVICLGCLFIITFLLISFTSELGRATSSPPGCRVTRSPYSHTFFWPTLWVWAAQGHTDSLNKLKQAKLHCLPETSKQKPQLRGHLTFKYTKCSALSFRKLPEQCSGGDMKEQYELSNSWNCPC